MLREEISGLCGSISGPCDSISGSTAALRRRMGADMIDLTRRPMAILCALGLALAPVAAAAEQDTPAAIPPAAALAAPQIEAHPALWKVSDGDTTIYLFGTIHLLPPNVDWFEGPVAKAFGGSQELVTEIVQPDAPTMQKITLAAARRTDGKTLRATLSPEEKAKYETALAGLGIPAGAFDNVDTWFAAVTLTVLPLVKEGYSTESGVDNQLGAKADARHVPHSALETAEYQLGLFDALPADVQLRYLDDTLDKLPEVGTELGKMVKAWEAGDADTLAKMMNDDMTDPVIGQVLLTNRNRNWSQWIEQRLKKPGTVFIAVGAGHLAGADSVQAMLAKDGVTAVRVQ
ncbi:TraB/GumN family protein [Novosphingobium sp. 9]|uniref:TraB/GumN family protein n=1 Tax=Novosphingobium sp. 9 TaxID=2025349 RepID=UPI0021B5B172|nr:TraB/GumN family protein [Novosphingobium sp. 9]